jgi:putative ribosome biogenesis GTPase RsgA
MESLVAFMGLTGSGKSSLINLLLGETRAKVGHEMQSGKHAGDALALAGR